jgi:hypothetical protein
MVLNLMVVVSVLTKVANQVERAKVVEVMVEIVMTIVMDLGVVVVIMTEEEVTMTEDEEAMIEEEVMTEVEATIEEEVTTTEGEEVMIEEEAMTEAEVMIEGTTIVMEDVIRHLSRSYYISKLRIYSDRKVLWNLMLILFSNRWVIMLQQIKSDFCFN